MKYVIQLFFGDNAYAKQQATLKLVEATKKKSHTPLIERFDGETLDPKQLSIILQGVSLFSPEKLVILRGASKNKMLWTELEAWIELIPEGTDLILVETTPDRRTKTFKLLQKYAEVKEYRNLTEQEAGKWLITEAKQRGEALTLKQAEQIIVRAGTDQWRLSNELAKLIAHGIDKGVVESLIEPSPQANVFALLDAVLHKKRSEVERHIAAAKISEDPYMLFGLMGAQLLQLATLVHGEGRSSEEIAKILGVHPFPLKKLTSLAHQTSPTELKVIIDAAARLDTQLKSTGLDPWLLLEQTLIKIATRGG